MVPELKDLDPQTGDVLSGQIVGLLISVGDEAMYVQATDQMG